MLHVVRGCMLVRRLPIVVLVSISSDCRVVVYHSLSLHFDFRKVGGSEMALVVRRRLALLDRLIGLGEIDLRMIVVR